MFDSAQKNLALEFARALSQRNYSYAHTMCSQELQLRLSVDGLRKDFEIMIPIDWGAVDPIELLEDVDFPFIYVVLGGDVYSEAIIIDSFSTESGEVKIDCFEFGRP